MLCLTNDCKRPAKVRGFCKSHYEKARVAGLGKLPRLTAQQRFWSYVEKTDACWVWVGTVDVSTGYGRLKVAGRMLMAHRYAYELLVGPIPEGLTLDHVKMRGCSRRDCVNPAHLEPVTRGENVLRGDGVTATNARKSKCVHNHEFTPENTYWCKNGRRCLTCKRRINRETMARQRRRAREEVGS